MSAHSLFCLVGTQLAAWGKYPAFSTAPATYLITCVQSQSSAPCCWTCSGINFVAIPVSCVVCRTSMPSIPGNSCLVQMSSRQETGKGIKHKTVFSWCGLEVDCKWVHAQTGFWQTLIIFRLSYFLIEWSLAISFSSPNFVFFIPKIGVLLLISFSYCED